MAKGPRAEPSCRSRRLNLSNGHIYSNSPRAGRDGLQGLENLACNESRHRLSRFVPLTDQVDMTDRMLFRRADRSADRALDEALGEADQ